MEKVATINGVTFINDTKATNVEAATYALDSFDQPVVWIVGGTDKGNDYSPLYELAKKHAKAMVCLGVDNQKIKDFFKDVFSEVTETKTAEDAVKVSYELAEKGDVVLLSPACASFDLFQNYAVRGVAFKKAVHQLKNKLDTENQVKEL